MLFRSSQGFAVAVANEVFKNLVQQVGETPIAQCKDKVYPVILGLTVQARSLEEDLRARERELSKARALTIDLAHSRNLVTHRAVINQLIGIGFSSDKTLRTHAAEWVSKIEDAYLGEAISESLLEENYNSFAACGRKIIIRCRARTRGVSLRQSKLFTTR